MKSTIIDEVVLQRQSNTFVSTQLMKESVNLNIREYKFFKWKQKSKMSEKKNNRIVSQICETIQIGNGCIKSMRRREREKMSRRNIWRDNSWDSSKKMKGTKTQIQESQTSSGRINTEKKTTNKNLGISHPTVKTQR